MKKIAGVLAGAVTLLVLSAAPAHAQMWVSFGPTIQKWNSGWDSKGFAVDFGATVMKGSKHSGAVYFDFARNVFTDEETDTSIVVGYRVTFMTDKKVRPFVHGSVGSMHWAETFPVTDSGNDPMVGAGGGVLFQFTDMIGAKAQYDFWKVNDDGWDNVSRLFFAGVVSWGGKK